MSVEKKFEQLEALGAEIKALEEKRAIICTEIAVATCPYKVGEVVFSKTGLGTNGLLIHDIKAPVYTSKSNRWDIHTFAISKDGTVSQRAKSVSEISGDSISRERPPVNHDCDNCPASGDCDIEAHVKKGKVAFSSGGIVGLATYVTSTNSNPENFMSAMRAALAILGGGVAEIKVFRDCLVAKSKDFPEAYQRGLPLVLQSLFNDVRREMMVSTLNDMKALSDALGVELGVSVGSLDSQVSMMVMPPVKERKLH